MHDPAVTFRPIGIIRTPYTEKPETPRQPGASGERTTGTVTLFPGQNFEQALEDLEGFERIWLLTLFDRAGGWKPKVLPPRGRTRRGLFATRSPHRPNPIGLSLCRLIGIKGRKLTVENPDLLDRTPVLDIKPYLPLVEAFPRARAGWLEPLESAPAYGITILEPARTQLAWLLEQHGIDLEPRLHTVLGRDPLPHPYRRIKAAAGNALILSIKSWRILYRLESQGLVMVERVMSGYGLPAGKGALRPGAALHDEAAHVEFQHRWDPSLLPPRS